MDSRKGRATLRPLPVSTFGEMVELGHVSIQPNCYLSFEPSQAPSVYELTSCSEQAWQ